MTTPSSAGGVRGRDVTLQRRVYGCVLRQELRLGSDDLVTDETDEELLQAIERDPQGGIARVLKRHGDLLLGRLRRHAYLHRQGNAHVDDVLQDAVLRLLDPQCRAELRAAGGSILPWLSRWGYWRLDDAGRRPQDPLPDEVPRPPDPPADDQLSAAELAVQQVFPLLSPRDRLILRMRYEERRTTEQVAEHLGISVAAAKKAAHDARERLRNHLKKAGIYFE